MSESVEAYTISVPDAALEKLSRRLSLTTFPDQLESPDEWDIGTPVSDVQRLVEYWKNGFDWRKSERELNELPNFKTGIEVDGFGTIDLHFVHQVSPVKGAIPLLFSHGWPGSFIEVKKLLPLLKGGGPTDSPAFHVVAPSLPNFGFSSGVSKKGFGPVKYAETFHKLMLKLGYDEYVTQGGDWGFSVTRAMGLLYPTHCKASHLNLVLAEAPTLTTSPLLAIQHALTPTTARDAAGHARSAWFAAEGYGYNVLQSTKPQTIGVALADSPAALLAWVLEKLHDWTDAYPWTDDEVLTWVAIYCFSTAGPAASARIYHESTHGDVTTADLRRWIPRVKLGLAHFPKDITVVPRSWGKTLGPVVWQSEHDRGGHFATWEVPEAVAADLRGMFGRKGPCFGIVAGKDGY